MSLNSYIAHYKCSSPPADFTTTPIGGAISVNTINSALLEEVLFKMSSAAEGGGDRTQRSKFFVKNTHSTEPLTSAKIYLPLSLDDWGTNDQTVAVQAVNTDDDDKFVRFKGHDTNGDPIQLDVNVDGTTMAATSSTYTAFQSCEVRSQSTGELAAVTSGNILSIYRNGATKLGEIIEGFYFASSEFDIWLPATLDDSITATDAGTDPSGVSWSRPRTEATALSVANSGSLTAGSAQGIFVRWTLPETTKPRSVIQIPIMVIGDDAL